jgi:hypothetical protein
VKQIDSLLRRREEMGHASGATPVRVGVKILLTQRNVQRECTELVTLIRRLFEDGVDHVKVRTMRSETNSPSPDNLRHAQDVFARLTFELHRDGYLANPKSLEVDVCERYVPTGFHCKLSTLFTLVDALGDVRMCWNDTNPDRQRVVGNAFTTQLRDIWGGARHREVCRAMNPELVCNSGQGCHCRFVGYQDAINHLEGEKMAMSLAADQQFGVDRFL